MVCRRWSSLGINRKLERSLQQCSRAMIFIGVIQQKAANGEFRLEVRRLFA
jgi:hypothetical protein